MKRETLTHRLARRDDLDSLKALMDTAISENQKTFLDESQIASSRAIGTILNLSMTERILLLK
jgi:hypothetical protein